VVQDGPDEGGACSDRWGSGRSCSVCPNWAARGIEAFLQRRHATSAGAPVHSRRSTHELEKLTSITAVSSRLSGYSCHRQRCRGGNRHEFRNQRGFWCHGLATFHVQKHIPALLSIVAIELIELLVTGNGAAGSKCEGRQAYRYHRRSGGPISTIASAAAFSAGIAVARDWAEFLRRGHRDDELLIYITVTAENGMDDGCPARRSFRA
jgi:hypothetical protein